MTKAEWWSTFDKHQDAMRALIVKYHPTSGKKHVASISASAAEDACEVVRNQILKQAKLPGSVRFDAAVQSRDDKVIISLLNDAWFGMPESRSVRYEPGFGELCDLCEGHDDYVDEEDDRPSA